MEPHIGSARLRDNGVAMEAMRAADMVIDLVGLHLLRGGERPRVLGRRPPASSTSPSRPRRSPG